MWLDRFAGAQGGSGTSTPHNRPYSPVRRTSQLPAGGGGAVGNKLNRPTYSPRSSSLSFSPTPNTSTSSLPGNQSQSNGLTIRQSSPRPTDANIPDPLDVLNNILGQRISSCSSKRPNKGTSVLEKPEILVDTIDFGDLSLEEFVEQGDNRTRIPKFSNGFESNRQYEQERDRFQDLHNSISGCDEVLKSVESYLTKFQNELGAVSVEIETLQSRSFHLSSQLENRKNVEKLLGPAVEDISVSPRTVRLISEGPIDQEWQKALAEVDGRLAVVNANTSVSDKMKAIEDVKPLLLNLKDKAVERIRDYLVAQIKAIRSPNMNAQIIQQQSLLKYKDLYGFLSTNSPVLSEEISQAYINTMKWYYLANFTRYNQALEKVKLHSVDRNDLLGGDPALQRGAHGLPSGRNQNSAHDPFALGRRADILKPSSSMALTSYLAEEDKSLHSLEVPFRNFNLALIDNISAEYSFMTEMFAAKSVQQASRKVLEIFEPVFALGHTLTKQLIENTTDCLGVLLCVRLNQHFAFELQRRKVPVADTYINGINMQLWPRFQMIMDMHYESLKRISSNSTRTSLSTLSLTAGDAQSSAPHFLTQRFGQFLHSILVLSNEAGDNEPLSNSLGRLINEFDALLTKLSRTSGDAKRRERFLFNNYSLILTIISDTKGKFASEQKERFETFINNSSGSKR